MFFRAEKDYSKQQCSNSGTPPVASEDATSIIRGKCERRQLKPSLFRHWSHQVSYVLYLVVERYGRERHLAYVRTYILFSEFNERVLELVPGISPCGVLVVAHQYQCYWMNWTLGTRQNVFGRYDCSSAMTMNDDENYSVRCSLQS